MTSRVFQDFVQFSDRYAPEFSKKLVGATVNEISAIESLAKVRLAPEHRSFLELMGNTPPKSLGRFLEYVTYGVEESRRFYGDPSIPPLPADIAFLWRFEYDSPFDHFLEVGGGLDARRPVLFLTWPVEGEAPTRSVVSGSLLEFLYTEAVLKIRRPLLEHSRRLTEVPRRAKPDPSLLAEQALELSTVAKELGFTPVPHVETNALYFDRPDALLMLQFEELASNYLYVDASSRREADRLCQVLADNLGYRVNKGN